MAQAGPDPAQIQLGELRVQTFPVENPRDLRIFIAESAYSDIARHAAEDTRVEIAGILVGEACRDHQGPYVEVAHIIRAEQAAKAGAQVTFTHETWGPIWKAMDERFPDKKIVGWYHSHPGFGIFLSDMDQFIHKNFFNSAAWQVAFVVDPKKEEEGFFAWREGEIRPAPFYWVGSEMHQSSPSPRLKEELAAGARLADPRRAAADLVDEPAARAEDVAHPDEIRWSGIFSYQNFFLTGLGALLIVLGFVIAIFLVRRDTQRLIDQTLVDAAAARDLDRALLATDLEHDLRAVQGAVGGVDSSAPTPQQIGEARTRIAAAIAKCRGIESGIEARVGGASAAADPSAASANEAVVRRLTALGLVRLARQRMQQATGAAASDRQREAESMLKLALQLDPALRAQLEALAVDSQARAKE